MSANPTSPEAQNNPLAIASVALAAAAWVIGLLGGCLTLVLFPPAALCFGILFVAGCLAAAIMGHVARGQVKDSHGMQTGDSLALTGLGLGWGGVGLTILLVCVGPLLVIPILALLGPSIGNVFSNIIEGIMTATPVP